MSFGSAPDRAPGKQKTLRRTRTWSSAQRKRTKPSSWRAPPKRSRIAASGSNSPKSTTANTVAMSTQSSNPAEAMCTALCLDKPSVRTSTQRISWTRSPAGASNPSRLLERFSRFRCRVPHLLLNLPLAVLVWWNLTFRVSLRVASRPSDAAVAHPFRDEALLSDEELAVQTGRDRMELHETRYSPRLSSCYGALRLRSHLSDSLDHQGRYAARGNLLQLPSLFHRQAEAG